MGITQTDPQLDREWEQSWNHYRHLESTRSQYLGFFFTVLLASVSVAISALKDVSPDDKATIFLGLFILAFVVFLITIGLFTAIKKIGYVLRRYEIIMNSVRLQSSIQSSSEFPFDLSDMKDYPREVLDSGLFSVQRSAEIILAVTAIVIVVFLLGLTVFIFQSSLQFGTYQKGLSVSIAVCAVFYVASVLGPLISISNNQ